MRAIPVIALLVLLASVLSAAGLAGTWAGIMDSSYGPIATTIKLETGAGVTGTVATEYFESKIENGKLDGVKVSFEIDTAYGRLAYAGTLAEDELRLNVTGPDGASMSLTAKRQK